MGKKYQREIPEVKYIITELITQQKGLSHQTEQKSWSVNQEIDVSRKYPAWKYRGRKKRKIQKRLQKLCSARRSHVYIIRLTEMQKRKLVRSNIWRHTARCHHATDSGSYINSQTGKMLNNNHEVHHRMTTKVERQKK